MTQKIDNAEPGSDTGKARARDSTYFDTPGGIFCEREEQSGKKRKESGEG